MTDFIGDVPKHVLELKSAVSFVNLFSHFFQKKVYSVFSIILLAGGNNLATGMV